MSFMPSETDDFLYQKKNQNGDTYIHTCKPIYVSTEIQRNKISNQTANPYANKGFY